MVREEKKEEFLQKCHDDYETRMDDHFFSAANITELEQCHFEVKSQLLAELPAKWRAQVGSSRMSSKIPTKLSQNLDEAFVKLKKYFEKSKSRDTKESTLRVHQMAMEYHTNEMDKYLQNRPNASPVEITMHHNQVSDEAVSLAKTESDGEMSHTAVEALRLALDERHDLYWFRAEINRKSMKDPAIGIDLGTTMCCVMVYYKGKVEVIENRGQGNIRTTPSYVAFDQDGTDTFGLVAKEQAYRQPEITIYDAKRMIGRSWNDEKLQEDMKKWPFEVVNEGDNAKVKTWGRTRFPHEVSARLLTRFRIMAEEYLHLSPGTIRKAVITVPAYFTEPQRRATSEAAECSGLQVLNILSEPTAAAIAYSWERRDTSGSRKALIYDLGGGTFDVAIAVVRPNNVEILAVDGDTHLGGQDFDQMLMDYCLREFKNTEGVDLEAGRNSSVKTVRDSARSALSRVKHQCEKTKERLSTSTKQTVLVEFIHQNKNMLVTVTRETLEELIRPLIQKTLDIVGQALDSVKGKGISGKGDIDDVILVGGSTRLKLVEKMLSEYFGGKQLCKHINPDEAVAYGAAVQAAILNNEENIMDIKVQDVTPLSLGIEVKGERFSTVIPKNSKIPCSHKRAFKTTLDNQTVVPITIYQGESSQAKDIKQLGHFKLEGLPPRPAGVEKLDVTMKIDTMGMLQVEAVSCTTKKSNAVTIKAERLGMDKATMIKVKEECEKIVMADR